MIGGWNVRGGTHTLCSLFVDGAGRSLGGCVVGWEKGEERSLSGTLECVDFKTRFGEGCIGTSWSWPLSHLERFREGVEDSAGFWSIGISELSVVG